MNIEFNVRVEVTKNKAVRVLLDNEVIKEIEPPFVAMNFPVTDITISDYITDSSYKNPEFVVDKSGKALYVAKLGFLNTLATWEVNKLGKLVVHISTGIDYISL